MVRGVILEDELVVVVVVVVAVEVWVVLVVVVVDVVAVVAVCVIVGWFVEFCTLFTLAGGLITLEEAGGRVETGWLSAGDISSIHC